MKRSLVRRHPSHPSHFIATLSALVACIVTLPAFAQTQTSTLREGTTMPHANDSHSTSVNASMAKVFAPTGTLRASINLGNPVLARIDPGTGQPVGVSVDLATELAKRLGVPLHLVPVDSAGASVDNVNRGNADIGFFAIDPKRGQEISFTGPYVLIEGFYAVRDSSPIATNQQVDQPGVTVAVGQGSAYDLFLTRELHRATIVRIPTSPAVVQAFVAQHLDVAAGVKQQLEKDAAAGGLRLLPQRFMVIRQAMGVPKSRGDEAAAYLSTFVGEMRTSGFVAASLERHRIAGAEVAKDGD